MKCPVCYSAMLQSSEQRTLKAGEHYVCPYGCYHEEYRLDGTRHYVVIRGHKTFITAPIIPLGFTNVANKAIAGNFSNPKDLNAVDQQQRIAFAAIKILVKAAQEALKEDLAETSIESLEEQVQRVYDNSQATIREGKLQLYDRPASLRHSSWTKA